MDSWEYKNVQMKTEPSFGAWSKLSDNNLVELERLQENEWEIQRIVNIRGSFGFTAHVLFMLKRKRK